MSEPVRLSLAEAEALARIVEGIRSELDDMPPSNNPGAFN